MHFARSVSGVGGGTAGTADQLLQAVNPISNRIVFPFQHSGLTFADPAPFESIYGFTFLTPQPPNTLQTISTEGLCTQLASERRHLIVSGPEEPHPAVCALTFARWRWLSVAWSQRGSVKMTSDNLFLDRQTVNIDAEGNMTAGKGHLSPAIWYFSTCRKVCRLSDRRRFFPLNKGPPQQYCKQLTRVWCAGYKKLLHLCVCVCGCVCLCGRMHCIGNAGRQWRLVLDRDRPVSCRVNTH